jgi:hypothetical protein
MMAMRVNRRQAPSGLFSDLPELSDSAVKKARRMVAGSSNFRLSSDKSSVTSPRAVPKREGLAAAKKSTQERKPRTVDA